MMSKKWERSVFHYTMLQYDLKEMGKSTLHYTELQYDVKEMGEISITLHNAAV